MTIMTIGTTLMSIKTHPLFIICTRTITAMKEREEEVVAATVVERVIIPWAVVIKVTKKVDLQENDRQANTCPLPPRTHTRSHRPH